MATNRRSQYVPQVGVATLGFNKANLSGKSNIVDPFDRKYGTGELQILPPPYNPSQLMRVPEYSKILPQCIRVYARNVHGFGWELEKAPHIAEAKVPPAEAEKEKRLLQSIFGHINSEFQNLTLLCQDKRADLEETGTAYLEIIRNGEGEIREMYLMPGWQVRMTRRDSKPTEFKQMVRNADGKYEEVWREKYFRRFVQLINGEKVYFKEFGDPRLISAKYGTEVSSTVRPATEVLMFRLRCGYSPYGLPRYIGQLISIMGARKAEEINYLYFDNKGVPPLVVLISGGVLAKAAKKQLQKLFEYELKGVDNFHKGLILEALPADVGEVAGEKFGNVRIQVQPLTQFMQQDALFMGYSKEAIRMGASAYQLPGIYLGLSDKGEYNRATAEKAVEVTETQVFQPERKKFNHIFNATVMADLGINYWTFKLVSPKTTDYPNIARALSGIKEAVSVGDLQEAAHELMGKVGAEIDESLYKIPLGILATGGAIETDDVEKAAKFIQKFIDRRKELIKRLEGDEDE